ncbi:hypothetical protein [Streptococcus sobrinus]|uniref:hypothetical protein n=1 Tax=Streptococcus sobrinus TaxID=1310 RepID=UPI00037F1138|nr:hypothetical protein [Streptococcus sobrinus]
MNDYQNNLIFTIINKSRASTWEDAVNEWDIIDCYEDNSLTSSCICGKEHIKYCYTIMNRFNNTKLFPIGSHCIHKFERQDLNEFVSINEKLFYLLHAIQNNEYITLNSKYFSRKLLRYLFEKGAFEENCFNHFNPEEDYKFLLNMFNQRGEPTEKQQRKINALIIKNILPYLNSVIGDKIV